MCLILPVFILGEVCAQDLEWDESDTLDYDLEWSEEENNILDDNSTGFNIQDSVLLKIKSDVVIKAGNGYIVGLEDPMHDILMDGTEMYYYKYALLDQNLDTVLSLEYDEMHFLPSFGYHEDDMYFDDEEISDKAEYQWILGYDEMASFLGDMTIEKYAVEFGHDSFIEKNKAMKGYMDDSSIQNCIYHTKAIMVETSQFYDVTTLKPLTPAYDQILINFTKDFILVQKDQKYGLIDRLTFKKVIPIKYDRLVYQADKKVVIGVIENMDVKIIPIESLQK